MYGGRLDRSSSLLRELLTSRISAPILPSSFLYEVLTMNSLRFAVPVLAFCCIVLCLSACSGTPESTDPIRLIDRISDATIEGSPQQTEEPAHAANWTFDAGLNGWSSPIGVDGLAVDNDALVGTVTMPDGGFGPSASLVVPLPELPQDGLWSIEVTARVSAGTNLAVRFGQGEKLILPAVFGNPMGIFQTPLQAGEDMQTYSIKPSNPVSMGEGPGHLVLTPSDAVGAEFAIERVRLILRKEYLNSVPSGPSWQGLAEIYRETLVSRAPETLHFDVQLPANPFLELAMGTLESADTTFRVEVSADGEPSRTWEQPVSEPDVWHTAQLDLDEHPGKNILNGLGGESVRISMSVQGAEDGTLGLWGAPAIRSGEAAASDQQASVAGDQEQPQGVILIITDTLRRDHLEAYGYGRDTAPNIAKLAAEGVRFADPISQATWTKVSVPAIQTGLYPTTHTIKWFPDRLPASATTMAEAFREAGYATFGLTSIPFVGRMTNLHQGYEILHETGAMADKGDPEDGATVKSSLQLVPKMLDWLDQRGDSKFFALLHVADAHSPFRPTAEHELHFAEAGDMDQLDEYTEQVRPLIKHPLMQRFGMPQRDELIGAKIEPSEFVRLEENGMDGSIKGMDMEIGKLIAKLEALGLRDKVMIGLVADHGTELLEHDSHFHGHTLYGELNRVPMLLWGPSFVPAADVAQTVQTIDLMPTMLEAAGLPLPTNIQGASLRPLWDDPEAAPWRRPAITEMPMNYRGSVGWSLISDGWKLVRLGPLDEEPSFELYDHTNDPLNHTDVAADNAEVVTRLAKLMENWRAEATAARLDDSAANAALDGAELERLRSLGYVQ